MLVGAVKPPCIPDRCDFAHLTTLKYMPLLSDPCMHWPRFDVLFDGSTMKCWLTTAPGQPTTHWFQLRCALQTPLQVRGGDFVTGEMVLKAHERQSYDIHLTLKAPPVTPGAPEQVVSAPRCETITLQSDFTVSCYTCSNPAWRPAAIMHYRQKQSWI